MKKISFLLFLTLLIGNQSFAQKDSTNFIREDYEIPAHNLYVQDWSAEFVVGRELPLPFGYNNDLKIILVDGANTPFVMPCEPEKVLSKYGPRNKQMHTGIDLKLALGAPVRCCFDGVVRLVKNSPSYGKVVVVRHYNGLETLYAHLDSICVGRDEIVKSGQLVGLAGRTGRASTEHLHFETRFLYTHFDPSKMIDFDEEELVSNILVLSKSDLHVEEEYPEENAVTPEPVPEVNKPQAPAAPTKPAAPTNGDYHIVKQGDTLYRIALNNHTTVEKLCRLNNIDENATLQLGQKIRVR
ncbi:MAG: peptidoglycan DD-metalloendopeptidase family protein [Bacteroidales bacterium]|nr:peptidoglycan DD-metalloendopeptidase family protein [Bacteroidales bacterium]